MSNNGDLIWLKQSNNFNTSSLDAMPQIIYFNEHIYMTYSTEGTIPNGENAGVRDIVVGKFDLDGNVIWLIQQNTFNSSSNDSESAICINPITEDVFFSFDTDGVIPDGILTGISDIVIGKINKDGVLQCIIQPIQINSPNVNTISALSCDLSGNLYVTHQTTGNVPGGTNVGESDIILSKFDSNCNFIWTKQDATINTTYDESKASICTSSSYIYMTYVTFGTVIGVGNANAFDGISDIAVIKLDFSGTVIWTKQNIFFNTPGYDFTPSICCNENNIFIAFSNENFKSVVVKFDTDGNIIWTKTSEINTLLIDSVEREHTTICDTDGNLYCAYVTDGAISGSTLIGDQGIVVFHLNNDGDLQWIKQESSFNASGTENNSPSIAIDTNNNVYVCYNTTGAVSGYTNIGSFDIVFFKLYNNISNEIINYINFVETKIKKNIVQLIFTINKNSNSLEKQYMNTYLKNTKYNKIRILDIIIINNITTKYILEII
jgi:hypothetical protein